MVLLLAAATPLDATVIDVVTVGVGNYGHAGTSTDPLMPSETIQIKIVLNADLNPTWYYGGGCPGYDGYYLSSIDMGLQVSGPGTLSENGTNPIMHHPDLTLSEPHIVDNGISYISGVSAGDGIQGEENLVWNMIIHCEGTGPVLVDLTLNTIGEYAEGLMSWAVPGVEWITLTEDDFGDLVIHTGDISPPDCWDETQCYGDANGDGFVDTLDWPAYRDSFYKCYPDPNYNPCADFNRDGCVNTEDWPPFRDWFYQSVPDDCPIGGIWPPE